jgi:hypothetical protein
MHEQIKKLYDKAWAETTNHHATMQRFAELIVRECAAAITNDDLAKDCGTLLMDSYAKGMRYSVEVIKEHFGIDNN